MNDCGSVLIFSGNREKYKLQQANFCRDRLCPMCQWRRSYKLFGQLSKIIEHIKSKDEYKDLRFIFLTLTCKNVDYKEIKDGLENLNSAWRYFSNKVISRRRYIEGTFKTIEITDRGNGFHPHIHVLMAVREDYFTSNDYMSHDDLVKIWRKCLKVDYDPIVDIRSVKSKRGSYEKAIAEVSKYSVKGSDILSVSNDIMNLHFLASALWHKRLTSYNGLFRSVYQLLGLSDVESDSADLVHADNEVLDPDLAVQVLRFRWGLTGYISF